MTETPYVGDFLKDSPRNWGKWGPDDEVGSLNYLTSAEVLRGVAEVRSGEVFTLQVRMGDPSGDPVWPGRESIQRTNVMDEGFFQRGEGVETPGGAHYSDDVATLYLQASTQYDSLGHVWYDGQIWNGYDAATTDGAMEKASVLPIAERGVVGRGVLIDVARHRGKAALDKGETFTHEDLLEIAAAQGSTIEKHDILVVRTGFVGSFYRQSAEEFYDGFLEPGLTYSPE
ncbi:cyclase family protein, partial [Aeromicrobium sp. Leaf272]